MRQGDDLSAGSVWTFCAIDADTKLVPAFKVGERVYTLLREADYSTSARNIDE